MRWIFAFLVFLMLIEGVSAIFVNATTGAITGKPMQYFGMNISIITPPVISLLAPRNETYFVNSSIPLNYSVDAGTESKWYKLDSGNNITITSSIFFNASEGAHKLFFYANNSQGESSTDVSFNVNSSIFRIIHEKWKGTQKGNSTNFSIWSYEQVQNMSIILENTSSGKILFNQNINMTDDENFSDGVLDLDTNIQILSNRIWINNTALPNFNKSATLWIYSLSFTDPEILRDGVTCPSAICTEEIYSGGILKFNVTQFSSAVYTIRETPVVTPPGGGEGGGGGGGGGGAAIPSFTINQTEIKLTLTPGETSTQRIIILNNLNRSINISLNKTESIKDFVTLEGNSIQLGPGESKEMVIDIEIRGDTPPDLYVGKISLSAEGTRAEILVSLEVESVEVLLDVTVTILKEYLKVYPGRDIFAEIKLLNLGGTGIRRDIKVEYIIKDSEGNELTREGEVVSLETQANWIKKLTVPRNIPKGKYVLYVRATADEEKIASASEIFEVVSLSEKVRITILLLLLILIIIISIILYILLRRRMKERKAGNQ